MTEVRVRFAPSPTGELHVGGLRTALFNYLFAKKHGGAFVLRIEDTDQERYVEGAEQGIVDVLEWAGLAPDEGPHKDGPHGPYRQSERLERYREAVEALIEAGHAYHCYCTPEELDEMRQAQLTRGQPPKYDGRHRNLTGEQRRRLEEEGRKAVVRMRIPDRDERLVVKDAVRGNVAFNSHQLDDQVLLKSDGFPTYHLAVVVDDHAMAISHILRAEEWLPSTPKHLLLYRWLGYPEPVFAHLPLLLNEDRSKMSKRKGDVAAEDYRAKGYLPGALVNFLALLGWSPGDDRELMSREELIEDFSLERIGKAGAVFDRAKLDWMNQHYIANGAPEEVDPQVFGFMDEARFGEMDGALRRRVAAAVKPSMVTLADINERAEVFVLPDDAPYPETVAATVAAPEGQAVLRAFRTLLAAEEGLSRDSFRAIMKSVQKETQLKGKALYGPMRAAITFREEGPDLAEAVEIFGRDKVQRRVERALAT